jgi:hypothetical protein
MQPWKVCRQEKRLVAGYQKRHGSDKELFHLDQYHQIERDPYFLANGADAAREIAEWASKTTVLSRPATAEVPPETKPQPRIWTRLPARGRPSRSGENVLDTSWIDRACSFRKAGM